MSDANEKNKSETISVIYQTRNNSPKSLQISRKKLLLFFIGFPLVSIIGVALGIIGLVHTSPFHLIQNFQKNNEAREAIARMNSLNSNLKRSLEENATLKQSNEKMQQELETKSTATQVTSTVNCSNPKEAAPMSTSIGLSTLSLFKPVQMQKDKTRPASLSLNEFKAANARDTVNLSFNIINLLGGDVKLAGHIVVLMKNEQMIEVYPMNALNSPRDFQINYSSGEPFATQRFRPVIASFPKPKHSGNFVFTVFIFGKNGDLIHFQSVYLPVNI